MKKIKHRTKMRRRILNNGWKMVEELHKLKSDVYDWRFEKFKIVQIRTKGRQVGNPNTGL